MNNQQNQPNNQANNTPMYQPPTVQQQPTVHQHPAGAQKTNTLAIVGLIVAFVFAPVGAILSFVALNQIKKTNEGGRGLALAGTIAGSIFTLFGIIYIILMATLFTQTINSSLDTDFGDTTITDDADATGGGSDKTKPSGGVGSTRDNPAALGTPLKTEDWTVVINSVNLDATEAVAAVNEYNDPAPDGQIYILVNATVTYTGKDASGQTPNLSVEYVTKQGNSFDAYSGTSFAQPPEKLELFETLYEGASLTGNILLTVPKDGVADGVLAVTPEFIADKVFIALQ